LFIFFHGINAWLPEVAVAHEAGMESKLVADWAHVAPDSPLGLLNCSFLADLKFVGRKAVGVQVPLRAP